MCMYRNVLVHIYNWADWKCCLIHACACTLLPWLLLLHVSGDSKYHWDRRTRDDPHFCDHHGNKVRGGDIIDEVEETEGGNVFPVSEEVALTTANGYEVIGVSYREWVERQGNSHHGHWDSIVSRAPFTRTVKHFPKRFKLNRLQTTLQGGLHKLIPKSAFTHTLNCFRKRFMCKQAYMV